MGRRPHKSGSKLQLPSGSWRLRWYDHRGQQSETFRGTAAQADARLRHITAAQDRGEQVGSAITVSDLADRFLSQRAAGLQPSTVNGYGRSLRLHIVPELGPLTLRELDHHHVQLAAKRWTDAGVTPTMLRTILTHLRMVLAWAVTHRLAPYNAALAISRPKREPAKVQPPTRSDVLAVLAQAKGTHLEAGYVLTVSTGLRIGELLALRWSDVDLSGPGKPVLHITKAKDQTTGKVKPFAKTAKSRRTITLAAGTATQLSALRGERPGSDPVVPRLDDPSAAVSARTLGEWHRAMVRKAGVPGFRWHDFRHYVVVELLRAGMPIHRVSAMLGHANIGVTLGTYGHLVASDVDLSALDLWA